MFLTDPWNVKHTETFKEKVRKYLMEQPDRTAEQEVRDSFLRVRACLKDQETVWQRCSSQNNCEVAMVALVLPQNIKKAMANTPDSFAVSVARSPQTQKHALLFTGSSCFIQACSFCLVQVEQHCEAHLRKAAEARNCNLHPLQYYGKTLRGLPGLAIEP